MRPLAILLLFLQSPRALGDDDRGPPPDPTQGEPSDGREPKRRLADDFLVVPRLLLLPPRLLWKGLSYPVQALAAGEERHHVSQRLYLMFTSWDGTIGVRPEVSYQLSFSPFFGFTFFDKRHLGRDTHFDVTFMMGAGSDLWFVRTRVRPLASWHATQLYLLAQYNRRDNQLFSGIGMDSTLGESRYQIGSVDIDAQVRSLVRPEVRLVAGAGFGWRDYAVAPPGFGDPSILQVYCVRAVNGMCTNRVDDTLVPGFNEGTRFIRVNAGFIADTRDSTFRPSSGAVVDALADYSHGIGEPSSYFRLRASATGVINLWKRSHLLLLRAWGMDVIPTNDTAVPFTELVVLGGPDDLRGVRWGRFRDYSGVLFSAEYRWPVWMWMDASLFADAGGVFGRDWSGFAINQLVPDIGGGLRIRTSQIFYFKLQTAWSASDGVQFYLSASAVP